MPQGWSGGPGDDGGAAAWAATAPELVGGLATRWGLRPDGPPAAGHLNVVWPVRDGSGRALTLKVGPQVSAARREADALRAWSGSGASVDLVRFDPDLGALLLQRLDPGRDLSRYADHLAATRIIAELLAQQRISPPDWAPALRTEEVRILSSIEDNARAHPGLLPDRDVDRARQTLADPAVVEPRWLLHFDAHYLNALAVPGADRWRLIDPLPIAGPAEWEPIPALRNRFADAAATGDPDRALRERLEIFVQALDLDRDLALAIAHAVAVDNLLWLLPRYPDHFFVPAYQVMLGW